MSKPVVAITRPKDRAKKACEIVKELGGVPVLAPTLDLEPVNTESLKNLVERKDDLDWIIFTSPTTIVSLNKFYPDFIKTLSCKLAVIGNKTGKLAEKNGMTVDLMPEDFTAEGLIEEFKKRGFKTAREYVIFRLANSEKAIYDSGLYGKAFEIEVRAYISGKGVYYVHTANRSDLRTKVFGATPEEVEIKIACGELNATLRKGCKWVIYCPDFDIRYPAKDQGHVMTREEWLDFLSNYNGKGKFLRLDKRTGEYHIQSFFVSEHKRPRASKPMTKYIYDYLDYVPTLAELIGR